MDKLRVDRHCRGDSSKRGPEWKQILPEGPHGAMVAKRMIEKLSGMGRAEQTLSNRPSVGLAGVTDETKQY